MIRAVTFDFWNTLYADFSFDERLRKRADFIKNELAKLGFDRSGIAVDNAFEIAGKRWLELWEDRHKSLSPVGIMETILYTLEVDVPNSVTRRLAKEMGEITLKVRPRLVDGVRGMLRQVCENYRLGIISDTVATPGLVLRRVMAEDRIEHYFRSFVFSDEIGFTKPTRFNFAKALEELGVEPSEAAHVGDMESTDIEGAKSFGMKAILFDGVNPKSDKKTKADLLVKNYDGFIDKIRELELT